MGIALAIAALSLAVSLIKAREDSNKRFSEKKVGCETEACTASSSGPGLDLARSLIDVRGTADEHDADLVAAELRKLPDNALQRLKDNGTRVLVCRNSVTEVRTDLKGVQPRGWPPGSTWDNVPGLGGGNQVVIATTGHSSSEGARVPKTGEGHGSANLVLHEVGHALDDSGGLSESDAFVAARDADLSTLSAYELQAGVAGRQETFAESAAMFYGGNAGFAAARPNLHGYFSNDPFGAETD